MEEPRTLYLVATPIGNLQDITYRAVEVLGRISVLVCEDTRITRRILQRYGLACPAVLFSCHEHNEHRVVDKIVRYLDAGQDVAYCSDAGSPGISDPGYLLVQAARQAGHRVEVLPGPSASLTALVASGLPHATFCFLGFVPRKSAQRQRLFAELAPLKQTLIFYESPQRLAAFLADAYTVFGDRKAAVTVELTKKFESVAQDWLKDLAARFHAQPVRGEITVVISGNVAKFQRMEASQPADAPIEDEPPDDSIENEPPESGRARGQKTWNHN